MKRLRQSLPTIHKYKELLNQNREIAKKEWDYLIILDACRYDCFEKLYGKYFEGNLRKCISPASTTLDWLKKSFTKRYEDTIYISGNPFVSSRTRRKGFVANVYFHQIVDVWDWGWDEKMNTVDPKQINYATLKSKKMHPDKRFIIHYLQPHVPYVCLRQTSIYKVASAVYWKMLSLLGKRTSQKLLKKLGLHQKHPAMQLQRYGRVNLREAYAINLQIVLSHVKSLIKDLSGKIVITSDHGELLGEDNNYGHFAGSKNPVLLEVPWFEVRSKSVSHKIRQETIYSEPERIFAPEEEIRRRLRALGYY